uniref:Uncharacterized protein n=1 Tax=Oryza brachyantha TaxID=4533 RepID=J3N8T4_ORYBR
STSFIIIIIITITLFRHNPSGYTCTFLIPNTTHRPDKTTADSEKHLTKAASN